MHTQQVVFVLIHVRVQAAFHSFKNWSSPPSVARLEQRLRRTFHSDTSMAMELSDGRGMICSWSGECTLWELELC